MSSNNSKDKFSDSLHSSDFSHSKSKEQLEYDKQKIIEIGDSIKETYDMLGNYIRRGINAGRLNNNSLEELLESLEDPNLKKILKG